MSAACPTLAPPSALSIADCNTANRNTADWNPDAWKTATDEELIQASRDNFGPTREDAVEELFRRHHSRIIGWCWRFTRDRESAMDLSQEIFLRAFRNLHNYRGECRFSTWLYVIARNLCMSAVQKRASEPVWSAKALTADLPDPSVMDIQSNMETEQTRSRSWNFILSTLNRTEAKVLTLHYGEELPLDTVSRMLGLTNKSGAKAYIVSARRKINAARSTAAGLGLPMKSSGSSTAKSAIVETL